MTAFELRVLAALDFDTPRLPGGIAESMGVVKAYRKPQHYARTVGRTLRRLKAAGLADLVSREPLRGYGWVRTRQ